MESATSYLSVRGVFPDRTHACGGVARRVRGCGAISWCGKLGQGEARGLCAIVAGSSDLGPGRRLWQGGRSEASPAPWCRAAHDPRLSRLGLEGCAPVCVVDTNVGRWRTHGAEVAFGGLVASPDSGGSVYFEGGEDRTG